AALPNRDDETASVRRVHWVLRARAAARVVDEACAVAPASRAGRRLARSWVVLRGDSASACDENEESEGATCRHRARRSNRCTSHTSHTCIRRIILIWVHGAPRAIAPALRRDGAVSACPKSVLRRPFR